MRARGHARLPDPIRASWSPLFAHTGALRRHSADRQTAWWPIARRNPPHDGTALPAGPPAPSFPREPREWLPRIRATVRWHGAARFAAFRPAGDRSGSAHFSDLPAAVVQ